MIPVQSSLSGMSSEVQGNQSAIPQRKLVRISESEAKRIQWKLIDSWRSQKDVWPLRYGTGILGAAAAITGAYYNSFYRRVTKVRHYGALTSLIPTVVVPSLLSMIAYRSFVTSDIIIYKTPCPVCVEMRAALIQNAIAVAYPLFMAPIGAFYMASSYYTYTVPPVRPVKEYLAHYWKITKPLTRRIQVTVVVHVCLTAVVTYLQYNAVDTINRTLDEQESDSHATQSH